MLAADATGVADLDSPDPQFAPQRADDLTTRLRARRRTFIKEHGRRVLFGVTSYLGRQSRIPNDPVLDPALFPWAERLRAQRRAFVK